MPAKGRSTQHAHFS